MHFYPFAPDRGGIITAFQTEGEDVFYMDPDTLYYWENMYMTTTQSC